MADPKIVTITQADTNPNSAFDPAPLIVIGGVPVTDAELLTALEGISGYNASNQQTLHNSAGTIEWVDD